MIFLLRFGRRRGLALVILVIGIVYTINWLAGTQIVFLARSWEFAGGVVLGTFWQEISSFVCRLTTRAIAVIAALAFFELGRFGIRVSYLPYCHH